MDRLKVDKFLGLYTNVDESKLNPEYQSEAVNVRFKAGYIESEGYIALEAKLPPNVIYAQMVRLDEDKLKNRLDDQGELVPSYTQDLTDHMLSVVQQKNFTLRFYIDDVEVFYGYNPVRSRSIIRIWNKNGIVIILTDVETYWLGKINHLATYPMDQRVGYFLYKYVDTDFQPSMTIEAGLFDDGKLDATITLLSFRDVRTTIEGNEDENDFDIIVRYYTIEARFTNGREQGTYEIAAYKALVGPNPTFSILRQDLVYNSVYVFRTGRLWDAFVANVFSSDGWEPYIHYNTIEKILATENLTAKLVFAEINRFIKPDTEFVFTYVFNSRDEYAIKSYKYRNNSEPGYILKLSDISMHGIVGLRQNLRITNINLYIRQNDKDDFEQVMSWDLIRGKQTNKKFDPIYIDMLSGNGIFLSQTIGTVYDSKKYKPIDKFLDYIEIDGVAYAISDQRVYFPSIGSGMIMNGVFLDYVPEVEGNLLSDINGTLGVFGSQLKLVVAQDSKEGYLLFSIKDKMNFRIRDQYDLATSPEGIIIHTKRGIYVTNGYERKLISEPINDIIEKNFDTGNIFYSPNDDMLFYIYHDGQNHFYTYRFDFVYNTWSEVRPGIAGKLTFSEDGIIHYLHENEGKVYKIEPTNNRYSSIRTPNVDLDYPFLGKNLIYIDVDFEGILDYENYNIQHTSRRTARLGIPVSKRIPKALIGARFNFKGKIYTIDIYYDAIGEFRDANHIPLPETLPERVQQSPEFFESITE